jgi:hypothetical protein
VEGWRWRLGRDGVLRGNTPRIVWSGVYVVQLKVIIKRIWFRGYCLLVIRLSLMAHDE